MKCFYYSRYRFYNKSSKKELKFFLMSDIHFSPKVTQFTLNSLISQIKELSPDYILIAGDLVDSLDAIDSASKLKRLTAWLSRLGEIAPTLISLGNHDFYRKNPKHNNIFSKKRHWHADDPQFLIDAVNQLTNVQILDNTTYEDKQVYIFGLTQSPEYFQFDRDEERTTSFLKPGGEDKNILLYDLKHLDPKLTKNLPNNKVKIAIIHSPVYLQDSEVSHHLSEFDFFVSGHMHNGVVPPVLIDFWRSDRGFFAPGKLLFPRNARTYITDPDQKSIICGAVSTIQDSAKPITFMNGVFPINIATLELSRRETLKNRPDVSHKYISTK